jgi:glycosyltransferase involved in cell wall biosynthesis
LRILIITQYFWPETFRVNDIVKFLRKKNYQVDVLTGIPNYPSGKLFEEYKLDKKKFNNYYGASVFRVPVFLRRDGSKIYLFLNYISFIISSIFFGFFLLRKKKYDAVFSFATSPLTSSLVAIFFSKIKSCKSFIWVLDLWPDILLELKIIKNIFLYKVVSKICKFIYQNFDYILSQSESFRKRISVYNNNNNNNNNILFPAWPEDIEYIKEYKNIKYNNDKCFKIVFTGNVGEAQNFDQVIKAARIIKDHDDIKWIIVGTGRELDKIKKIISEEKINNFILEGQKSLADISYYHSIADILFISLKSGSAISSTLPGKLQTYLNSNKFILGMIEGEAKRVIEDSKMGCCVDPNSPEDLAKKILHLKNHPEILNKVNNSNFGKEYLDKYFNKNIILMNLIKSFDEVYNSYEKIILIKDSSQIPYDKNFALSGFNLAFLGYLNSKKINLHKYLLNWPDGIFKGRFYGKDIPKVSGLNIINNLKIPSLIKNIYVLGSLTKNSKEFLFNKFYNFKLTHVNLPYDKVENLYNLCPKNFTEKDLIILTLPTPKQEQLAELIIKNNKYFKILCLGGAIAMASGEEKPVPKVLDKFNLEFLWRLRQDTRRRIFRLLYSLYFYLYGELTFRFKKTKFTLLL